MGIDMSIIVWVIISTIADISNLEVCTYETYQAKRVRLSQLSFHSRIFCLYWFSFLPESSETAP